MHPCLNLMIICHASMSRFDDHLHVCTMYPCLNVMIIILSCTIMYSYLFGSSCSLNAQGCKRGISVCRTFHLQHLRTPRNTLQHLVTSRNTLQHMATACNTSLPCNTSTSRNRNISQHLATPTTSRPTIFNKSYSIPHPSSLHLFMLPCIRDHLSPPLHVPWDSCNTCNTSKKSMIACVVEFLPNYYVQSMFTDTVHVLLC